MTLSASVVSTTLFFTALGLGTAWLAQRLAVGRLRRLYVTKRGLQPHPDGGVFGSAGAVVKGTVDPETLEITTPEPLDLDGLTVDLDHVVLTGARLPYLAPVLRVHNPRISPAVRLDPIRCVSPPNAPAGKAPETTSPDASPGASPNLSPNPSPGAVFGAWDWAQTLVAREDRPGLVWLRNAGGRVANQTVELTLGRWNHRDGAALAQLDNLLHVAAVLGPPDPASDDELLQRVHPPAEAQESRHKGSQTRAVPLDERPDAEVLRAIDLLAQRQKGWPQAEDALAYAATHGRPTVRVAAARALGRALEPVEELAPALAVLRDPASFPNSLINAFHAAAPHLRDRQVAAAVTRCATWLLNRLDRSQVTRQVEAFERPEWVAPWRFDSGDRWRRLSKPGWWKQRGRTLSVRDVVRTDEEATFLRASVIAAPLLARVDSTQAQMMLERMEDLGIPALRRAAAATGHSGDAG